MLRICLTVLLGASALALGAQISVPLWPVPATAQSLVVLLLGALFGWRVGLLAVALYLAAAALGLPVLANGRSGLAVMRGATAGYLVGFAVAVVLAARAGAGPWAGRLAWLVLAHLVLLALGTAWLAGFLGASRAWQIGFVNFLPGAALKVALALVILRAWPQWRGASPR